MIISKLGNAKPYLLAVLRIVGRQITSSAGDKCTRRRSGKSVIYSHHSHGLRSSAGISRNANAIRVNFWPCKHVIYSPHLVTEKICFHKAACSNGGNAGCVVVIGAGFYKMLILCLVKVSSALPLSYRINGKHNEPCVGQYGADRLIFLVKPASGRVAAYKQHCRRRRGKPIGYVERACYPNVLPGLKSYIFNAVARQLHSGEHLWRKRRIVKGNGPQVVQKMLLHEGVIMFKLAGTLNGLAHVVCKLKALFLPLV